MTKCKHCNKGATYFVSLTISAHHPFLSDIDKMKPEEIKEISKFSKTTKATFCDYECFSKWWEGIER